MNQTDVPPPSDDELREFESIARDALDPAFRLIVLRLVKEIGRLRVVIQLQDEREQLRLERRRKADPVLIALQRYEGEKN